MNKLEYEVVASLLYKNATDGGNHVLQSLIKVGHDFEMAYLYFDDDGYWSIESTCYELNTCTEDEAIEFRDKAVNCKFESLYDGIKLYELVAVTGADNEEEKESYVNIAIQDERGLAVLHFTREWETQQITMRSSWWRSTKMEQEEFQKLVVDIMKEVVKA